MIKYKEITANAFNYVMAKKQMIVIITLVGVLLSILIEDIKVKETGDILKPIENALNKPELPTPPTVETCEPVIKKAITVNGEGLFKNSKFVVLDLATFELFKKKRLDNNRVGYYYRLSGAEKQWYTVFKKEPLLDINGGK